LIAQQRKAEEEEAKRRARAKAEQKQAKARAAEKATEKSAERSEANTARGVAKVSPEPDLPPTTDASGFGSMKGKLKLPVKGELVASFGARRGDGPNWKGLFIRASEGAEVRVVEKGEVIFADWMRGFGNLLVVDHGGQYMTIYGNNQSLLKRPGDKLKAGEVIATVGNSGGNEQSGLYFEMRYQGRAIDPSLWMNR